MSQDTDTTTLIPCTLAGHLLSARTSSATPLAGVSKAFIPADETEAYSVQDEVTRALGPVCGWKVGASSPEAEPAAAPLHAGTIFPNGAIIPADLCRHRGVEAEIAWRFSQGVTGPAENITRTAVMDAIGSVHPVIELVDTRFAEPGSQHPLVHLADQQNHGALIVGPAIKSWRSHDPLSEPVTMRIDHRKVLSRTGGNAAGDPMRLLLWLARHAAQRGLPIEAGTIVTTGSVTGTQFVPHRTHVSAEFGTLGQVSAFLA
ncbi:2-keto-4-pentenoate hydratase [Acetobacter fallax]|uniref:2-keto-4-pentenoate hydratase n=1 Tax=Acetobacter fallax TaxID=1737473 RepID=A0ABX0KC96_9PROT|nr:fumarylacetoacetate hydrolase family protein [Acetobacter fallax]NHO33074.1 2-keto-4-pentenoate hydratase [Acetobacter fallax]NHO36680.1 2-keto-4-pentenoate hydratase [Acetobacter fallax]